MKQSRPVIFATIALLAALFIAVSGCSLGGEDETYSDPSIPIVVEVGQEFVIVLESNPTTGYQWQLAEPLEEEVLSLVKTEFEEPEEDLVGAGGEERWTFKAEGRGDTVIDFTYVRPWEEEPEETIEELAEGLAEKEEPELAVDEQEEEDEEEETEAEPEVEDETTESEEDEVEEIGAPEEEDDTMHKTFVVEVKGEGSKEAEPEEYDDPETEIKVEQDFKFAIQLESSPSAGLSWQLARPLDESIVELVKTEYEMEKKSDGHGGEGEEEHREGIETWTFMAVGEGETEIHFEYVNTTEEEAAPEEEKAFKVKVHTGEEGTDITHD
jgi:predicted secreted protein